ncbi:hypothetical protein FHS39_002610 [Streptomyces olivoverticillatus]|uniref:Uncharacterized protein n=1 Tax=Streptomyces olivoverticillatus TaxID=66427 RepID=A0A7W7LNX0_9ACTN|nr:hypothetical protein [Streptomyces olivoverticillatus]
MNDLPPDLPRLRTLETYLELQLQRVRDAIEGLEPTKEETKAEGWVLQHIPSPRDKPLSWLHTSTCILAKGGARLTRREARLALAEAGVRPCETCHPERVLTSD